MHPIPATYGCVAAGLATLVSGRPTTIGGLCALLGVFVVAYWGKYSSSHSFISRHRSMWTPTQRRKVQLAEINAETLREAPRDPEWK